MIKLVHLYRKEMSIYGDISNLEILSFILRELCLDWQIINYQAAPGKSPAAAAAAETALTGADFFFLGGGQDQDQIDILKDLQKIKKTIREQISEQGAIFLGICGGYQLLGEYYCIAGRKFQGLNLLDFYTENSCSKHSSKYKEKRLIGNTKAQSSNKSIGRIFGFENHAGRTFLKEKNKALARIEQGSGNNGLDRTEGVFSSLNKGLIIGSYFHSFLPKNFQVALFIVRKILEKQKITLSQKKFWEINQTLENLNRVQLEKLKY